MHKYNIKHTAARAIAFIIGGIGILSLSLSASANPRILWRETVRNFGAFMEDMGPVTAEFTFVNIGDEPLVILSARASCGCTRPSYSQESVAPGDSGVVCVTYDPSARPGRFDKKVVVETNTTPRRSNLHVRGVVIGSEESVTAHYPAQFGPLKLRNGSVMMGEVSKNRLKTNYVEGYNATTDSIRPVLRDLPSYVDVSILPQVVPPGEQTTMVFYYRGAKVPEYGLVEDTFTLIPDSLHPINISAVVNEDFSRLSASDLKKAPHASVTPSSIDLGTLRRDSDSPVHATFEVTNDGNGAAMHIRRIYTLDPGIRIEYDARKPIKKGKKLTVNVYVTPSDLPGALLNGRISVITDSPEQPVTTIRIVGELK